MVANVIFICKRFSGNTAKLIDKASNLKSYSNLARFKIALSYSKLQDGSIIYSVITREGRILSVCAIF